MRYVFLIIVILAIITEVTTRKIQCGILSGRVNSPNCTIAAQHIIKGKISGAHTWPWQMFLTDNIGHRGGVLIHPRLALTAAHCIDLFNLSTTEIFGKLYKYSDRNNNSVKWWKSGIKKIYKYPKYYELRRKHDLAILEFAIVAPISKKLSPICLPQKNDAVIKGEGCYATGWGRIGNGHFTNRLREVCVPIVPRDECAELFASYNDTLPKYTICAGYLEGGVGVYKGDSGGPLMCKRDNVWKLFGIVGGGDDSSNLNYPGYYVIIPHYLDWIRKIIQKIDTKQPA